MFIAGPRNGGESIITMRQVLHTVPRWVALQCSAAVNVCVCVCWSLMMGRHKRWSERKTRQENRDMRKVDKKGERQRRWERWGSETQLHSFGDAHILVHISPCDQRNPKTSNCLVSTGATRSDSH